MAFGALAAVLLLTAACESDGAKGAACSSAAAIDDFLGVPPSQGRAEDCGAQGGQVASRTAGTQPVAYNQTDDQMGRSPDQLAADRTVVKDIQKRLRALGYDPGSSDGRMGPKTHAAIRGYQKSAGLPADGRITETLIQRIHAERAG